MKLDPEDAYNILKMQMNILQKSEKGVDNEIRAIVNAKVSEIDLFLPINAYAIFLKLLWIKS